MWHLKVYAACQGVCCLPTCLWKKYVARRAVSAHPLPIVRVHNGIRKVLLLGVVRTNQQACVSCRKSQYLEAVTLSNIDR